MSLRLLGTSQARERTLSLRRLIDHPTTAPFIRQSAGALLSETTGWLLIGIAKEVLFEDPTLALVKETNSFLGRTSWVVEPQAPSTRRLERDGWSGAAIADYFETAIEFVRPSYVSIQLFEVNRVGLWLEQGDDAVSLLSLVLFADDFTWEDFVGTELAKIRHALEVLPRYGPVALHILEGSVLADGYFDLAARIRATSTERARWNDDEVAGNEIIIAEQEAHEKLALVLKGWRAATDERSQARLARLSEDITELLAESYVGGRLISQANWESLIQS